MARPWFKSANGRLQGGHPGAYLQQRLGPKSLHPRTAHL